MDGVFTRPDADNVARPMGMKISATPMNVPIT